MAKGFKDIAGGFRRTSSKNAPIARTWAPRVALVDDDASSNAGVARLLKSLNMTSRSFGTVTEFVGALDVFDPNCIVAEFRLSDRSGLSLQDELGARRLPTPIVFLTAYGDVKGAVRAMIGGAINVLTKPCNEHELVDSIQNGLRLDWARRQRAKRIDALRLRLDTLTPREQATLVLIASGRRNDEIAAELRVAPSTVATYREHIQKKMGTRSPTKLVHMALELDLIEIGGAVVSDT